MKLFSKKVDPKEQMRASKRQMSKGARGGIFPTDLHKHVDIQKELLSLQREEAILIADIKKEAKRGNTQATKILAQSLVRLRGQMNRLRSSEAQIRGAKAAITTSSATSIVTNSMGSVAKAMEAVGKTNDPKAIQKVMQQYSKESMKMEMAGEMMDDALDSVFDQENEESETDDIMNEVLDSIGIDLTAQMKSAPRTKLPNKEVIEEESQEDLDDSLSARLAALK